MSSDDKDKKPDPQTLTTTDFIQVADVQGSLRIVNELAKGLSVGMPTEMFAAYQNVIESQSVALKLMTDTVDRFNIIAGPISEAVDRINTISGPISEVVDRIATFTGPTAGVGLAIASANSALATGLISIDQLEATRKISSLVLDIQDLQGKALSTLNGSIAFPQSIQLGGLDSFEMIGSGVSTMVRAIPVYPSTLAIPSLEIVHEAAELSSSDLARHQDRLDAILLGIDAELVGYRRACWSTFRAKEFDYVGQASGSMRRLVDKVIRQLAPVDTVKGSPHFTKSPAAADENGRPTRKTRILHIAAPSGEATEHVLRVVEALLQAHKNLSAWDHEPLADDAFVEGAFVAIEGLLLSVLAAREA